MGRYEESNRILLRLLHNGGYDIAACLYRLGLNYIGIYDYINAEDCLTKCIRANPEGEYSLDAEELLDMIQEEFDIPEISDAKSRRAYELSEKGKHELNSNNFEKAIRLFTRSLDLVPDVPYVKNNLSLALFLSGQAEKAKECALEVLEKKPDNIHAICNLAIFSTALSDYNGRTKYIDLLKQTKPDSLEDTYKVALTLCEAGEDAYALPWFEKAAEYSPYNTQVLFMTGAAAYNSGNYAKAVKYFEKMKKADPNDSIGVYYRKAAKDALEGSTQLNRIEYQCQVPFDEIVRRIKYLNKCTSLKGQDLTELWRCDAQFKSYVVWALGLKDILTKKAMIDLLGMIGDSTAEEILRDFIMRTDEPESIKREAMTNLKRIGAKEPYIAATKEGIVEARVTMIDIDANEIPEEYADVAELIIRKMRKRKLDGYIEDALKIWSGYINSLKGRFKKIVRVEGWAAAVDYITMKKFKSDIMLDEICEIYKVGQSTVERCRKLITASINAKEDNADDN